jgi:HD-GYP domain-containing protein (c-di-GMP phosphodiesterase class II)
VRHSRETPARPPRSAAELVPSATGRRRWHVRVDVPRFIALLAVAAGASLLIPRLRWTPTDSSWIPAFFILTALSIVLEFVAVELPHGGTVSIATMAHMAAILLVPPPFAALAVGSAVLLEEVLHRRPPTRIAFNVSNHVLTISLASLVVGVIGDPRAVIAGHEHVQLAAMVVLLSLVYYLVNDILTSAIMALATGRSLVYLVLTNGRTTMLAEAAAGLVGVLFAVIWIVEPLWTILLVVPGAVIAKAIQYISQLEHETREAVGYLAEVIDHRDASTFHHSERVALYAVAIAQELQLSESLIALIEQAATVHDLGKIGISDRILLKPGPLTAEERTAMWRHTEIGSRILSAFRLFGAGASIVRHHHEAFDGSGYPDGLAGEAIPMGARVVAVADALDAMTSDRPYRQALSLDEALARFRAGAGRHWDPVVVNAMLGLVESGRLRLDASRIFDEADSNNREGEPAGDGLGLDTGRDAA